MRSNSVVIAANAGFLAEMLGDILRDLDVRPVTVQEENDLLDRITSGFPRIVLLENCFHEQATEEYIQRLTRRYPDLRVAVWSASAVRPATAARYIFAGAGSYFSLRGGEEMVKGILARILTGKDYCPDEVREIIEKGSYVPRTGKGLTMREVEIVKLSITGRSRKEIAAVLGVKPSTVKMHKLNIYRKCGGSSPVDMLRYGLINGVIGLEDLEGV